MKKTIRAIVLVAIMLAAIGAKADRVWAWQGDVACFQTDRKRIGLIDRNEQIIIEPIYDAIKPFSENGIAAFRIGSKWGYVNKEGEIISEAQWDYAFSFDYDDECASGMVYKDGKVGYVAVDGTMICEPKWKQPGSPFSNGFARVGKGEENGYINRKGALIIPCRYTDASPFSEGLAAVQDYKDGPYYYIDIYNQIAIENKDKTYIAAYPFSDGLARVAVRDKSNGEYSTEYIDANGETVMSFPSISSFNSDYSDGLVFIYEDGLRKGEYWNKDGKRVLSIFDNRENYPSEFAPIHWGKPFINGIAAVNSFDSWYLIKKNGDMITNRSYFYVSHILPNAIWVSINDEGYWLNTDGKVICEDDMTNAEVFWNSYPLI